ncbi:MULTISPECIES: PDR/VanB family oxidoreductase [Paraburkholderia]|uniref:PDR/VanB family oxidoreductase n=1 Tax=Paraburkholderia TaxID=1822464 RepID=UPI000380A6AA|nr:MULTISPECIES: PDR/VanB family oxidoreductase [Paraburkholderia]MDH6153654.1 vanillate O-demethylase ferredoxin subunit [Paraburkholderia sp. WSM4179]
MKVKLVRKVDAAEGICEFHLGLAGGEALPAFSPGAHIDVFLGDLIRQYSLCNDPRDTRRYVLGVLREAASRGGSRAMHALVEGDEIEISEPKNHFPLDGRAKHSILIAGGIGVTPILCMAQFLARIGASFEVHYCARDRARAAFRERFVQMDLIDHSHLYFDSDAGSATLNLAEALGAPHPTRHLYVCGPGGLIETCLNAANASGWDDTTVHREYFAAQPALVGVKGGFAIKLARSGRTIQVCPNQRVIDALVDAGVRIPVSCEEGTCGTCLTTVLEGEPDHRDTYLTGRERKANDRFLPCCSRSKSQVLVLDL